MPCAECHVTFEMCPVLHVAFKAESEAPSRKAAYSFYAMMHRSMTMIHNARTHTFKSYDKIQAGL